VIRALTEETGHQSTSLMMAPSPSHAYPRGRELARRRIEEITADVEVGRIYEGTVLKLLDFGRIVSVLPARMACCTSRRLRTSVSTPSPTISR